MQYIKCSRCLEGELRPYINESMCCTVCGYVYSHDTYIKLLGAQNAGKS